MQSPFFKNLGVMANKRLTQYYQVKRGCGLEMLTAEQVGEIFLALETYYAGGIESRVAFSDKTQALVYKQLCDHIDEENARYEHYCEVKKKASHSRQSYKNKDTSCDNARHQTTSYDNIRHQTTSNTNTNTKTNTKTNQQQIVELSAVLPADDAANIILDECLTDNWIANTSEVLLIQEQDVRDGLKQIARQIVNESKTYESKADLMRHIDAWLRTAKRIKAEETARLNKINGVSNTNKSNADDKSRGFNAIYRDPNEYDEGF